MTHYGIPLYIIDGYNVILSAGFSSENREIDDAKGMLLALLDSYAAKKMVDVTVVWDGKGPVESSRKDARRVRNIYTQGAQSADEKILRMVESTQRRGRITVVSDDRRHITGIVKSLGVKTMGVREFLSLINYTPSRKMKREVKRMEEDEKKEINDDLSVEDWMKLFRSHGRKR